MIIDKLRRAADCVPLWAIIMNAAADEIERLQKREDHLVNVGSVDKIKADTLREAIDHADEFADDASDWIKLIKLCANKLERGEA